MLLSMPGWLITGLSVDPRQALYLLLIRLLKAVWLRAKCPKFQGLLFCVSFLCLRDQTMLWTLSSGTHWWWKCRGISAMSISPP